MKRALENSDVDEPATKKVADGNYDDIDKKPEKFTRKCPYLDTVSRQKLDFDQQKICSITLTNMNVYACLVCGKYFQGRGKETPAYTHSVQMGHFVFINLQDTRTYCLPDGYEITEAALIDVKRCLFPTFTLPEIQSLNTKTTLARDVYGVSYLPGFVGLNNLNCTDYINVVLHALSHVTPLRDFFLQDPLPGTSQHYLQLHEKYPILKVFADVVRKLWSPYNFKSVISPAEFAHILSMKSDNKFSVGKRCEVSELYNWLLNDIHRNLVAIDKESSMRSSKQQQIKKNKLKFKSIIQSTFQGEIEVRTQPIKSTNQFTGQSQGMDIVDGSPTDASIKIQTVPYYMLSLDIPPAPLFRDSQGAAVIPQIPLLELLKKFDGSTWSEKLTESGACRKQYSIRKLPQYLVFHLTRFSHSGFSFQEEKNNTIVTFPIKNLEMKDYMMKPTSASSSSSSSSSSSENGGESHVGDLPSEEQINGMGIHDLHQLVKQHGNTDLQREAQSAIEKSNLIDIAKRCIQVVRLEQQQAAGTKYDLVANICHDTLTAQGLTVGLTTNRPTNKTTTSTTTASASASNTNATTTSTSSSTTAGPNGSALQSGTYRIHLLNKGTGQWFEIQDLHVSETIPQLVGLSESNMLIYERQTLTPAGPNRNTGGIDKLHKAMDTVESKG